MFYSFFNIGARGRGWSRLCPGRPPGEREPVPVVQEAGLAVGSAWTDAENRGKSGNDQVATRERFQRNCRHAVGMGETKTGYCIAAKLFGNNPKQSKKCRYLV